VNQNSTNPSAAASYTFSFTTANVIPNGGSIVIENIPNLSYTLSGTCTTASGSFGVCTNDTNVNGIYVPVTAEIPKGTSLSISTGTWTNPSIPSSASFSIKSYTTAAKTYIIDSVSAGLTIQLK
jgi:hypothetical protein